MLTAKYVYIRTDTVKTPLQKPYSGPYTVLAPGEKEFLVDMGGRVERISIDRLKPAQVDPTKPVQLQQPARRGRPPALPGPPSATETDDNLRLRLTTNSSHHARCDKCDRLCVSSNSARCLCWGEVCGGLSNQIVPFRHRFCALRHTKTSCLGEPCRWASGPKRGEFKCYSFNRHDVSIDVIACDSDLDIHLFEITSGSPM